MKRTDLTRLLCAVVTGLLAAAWAGTAVGDQQGDYRERVGEEQAQGDPDRIRTPGQCKDAVLDVLVEQVQEQWMPFQRGGFNGAQEGQYPGGRPGP